MPKVIGDVPWFLTYIVLMVDDPGSNAPQAKEVSGMVHALFSYTLTFIALMLPVFDTLTELIRAMAVAVSKIATAATDTPIAVFCIAIEDAWSLLIS